MSYVLSKAEAGRVQVDVANRVERETADHTSTDLQWVDPVHVKIPPRLKLRCYELRALAVAFEMPMQKRYRDLDCRIHVGVRARDDKICCEARQQEEEVFCSIPVSQTTELRCLVNEKAEGFELVRMKSATLLVGAAVFDFPTFAV